MTWGDRRRERAQTRTGIFSLERRLPGRLKHDNILEMAHTFSGAGQPERRRLGQRASSNRVHAVIPVVYSPNYNITALGLERLHPFDSIKYRRIHEWLIRQGLRKKGN